MVSNSDFDSDYIFRPDFREILPSITAENVAIPMWNYESFPLVGNGANDILLSDNDTVLSVSGMSFPERLGIPAMEMSAPALSECEMGLCSIAGIQSIGAEFQPEAYDFTEKCNRFASDFQPLYGGQDVWAVQGSTLPRIEEPAGMKVGRYSVEERKDRILKYLKKRNQRNFNKTIKYACRKTLADRRIRVRGRFARNNDLGEESMIEKNNNNRREEEEYYDDGAQIKFNGEEWLQEAVTSLMYLPIFAG